MKEYFVIEERGYGIEYPDFFGSLEDCQKFIDFRLAAQAADPESYVNGNGDPFTYRIEVDY